jgi:peptide chain release factor subunit 1
VITLEEKEARINALYLTSPNKDIITLYVRPETKRQKILDLLKKEEPIIDNIKSRVTREGIKASFQHLKTFIEKMPISENGYIICTSSEKLVYVTDIRVNRDKYSCGGEFYSTPLEEELALRLHPIGIIALDTQEATIAFIGTKIEILKNMTSGIAGKHNKGGQSQRRFERDREMQILNFFHRIADASKIFVESYPIEELLVSGCGQTKNKFLDTQYLDYRLRKKVTLTLDTQYTGDAGIRETLHKALPLLQKNAYAKEVKIVEDFFELMNTNFERIVYGKDDIEKNLHSITRIIKLEENTLSYEKETIVLHFKGEHADKIRALGGIVGERREAI